MDIEWEDPAPSTSTKKNSAWREEAAMLQAHPGEWGVIAKYPANEYSKAANFSRTIRNGLLPAFRPQGAFDSTVRAGKDGTVRVYARAMPEQQ